MLTVTNVTCARDKGENLSFLFPYLFALPGVETSVLPKTSCDIGDIGTQGAASGGEQPSCRSKASSDIGDNRHSEGFVASVSFGFNEKLGDRCSDIGVRWRHGACHIPGYL